MNVLTCARVLYADSWCQIRKKHARRCDAIQAIVDRQNQKRTSSWFRVRHDSREFMFRRKCSSYLFENEPLSERIRHKHFIKRRILCTRAKRWHAHYLIGPRRRQAAHDTIMVDGSTSVACEQRTALCVICTNIYY